MNKVNKKTVAEHLDDYLERRNVKHIFGLCGHTNIAVYALSESKIEFVTVRHEQIASHAADAYELLKNHRLYYLTYHQD